MATKKAVLMLAYGSPESLDDMAYYLNDIRGGRPMSEQFVAEFKRRYSLIGEKSPLTELTYQQAKNLDRVLQKRGYDWPVYLGMRHWSPWIKDAIGQMDIHGVEEAVAIVMAPHYSRMSIGKYWQQVQAAQELRGTDIKIRPVDSWYQQPNFLQAVENRVRAGLEQFPAETRDRVKLVFTAHSLPARLLEMGDPYNNQLKDNARLVAERLGHQEWMLAYQSAAQTGEPWLGPDIEQVVVDLARAGYKDMLVAPIGFVCDHVEILYDIDISARNIAQENGLRLERTESMNSTPLFIEAVADAAIEGMAE